MVSMKPIGADKNRRGDSLVSGWLCVWVWVCVRACAYTCFQEENDSDRCAANSTLPFFLPVSSSHLLFLKSFRKNHLRRPR